MEVSARSVLADLALGGWIEPAADAGQALAGLRESGAYHAFHRLADALDAPDDVAAFADLRLTRGVRVRHAFAERGVHIHVASEVGRDRVAALPLAARSQITGLSLVGGEALELLEPKRLPALVALEVALDEPFGPELAQQIAKFDLRHLVLSHCGVGAKGLLALTHLPLHTLRLFFDRVAEGAKHLAAFKQLTELALDACDVTAKVVESVSELPLRTLSLSKNRDLTGVGLRPLKQAKNLQSLDLTETPVGDAGLDVLGALPHLRELRLHRSRLTAKAAKPLEALVSLRALDLSGNALNAVTVQALGKLPSLTVLDLTGCELGRPALDGLSRLVSLRSLDISNNDVKAAAVEALAHLTLERLAVNNSMVGDKGAATLSKLASLKRLELADADVGPKGMLQLAKLTSLWLLDVMNNEFEVAGAAAFESLVALEELSCSTALGDRVAAVLGRLPGLHSLRARQAALGPKGAAALARASLVDLDLSGSEIGDVGATSLAEVRTLRRLKLDGNGIGPKGAAALAKLPLRELSLAGNPVGAGVRDLESIRTLEDLDLSDVRLDKAARTRLAKALPGCLLEFGD